MTRRLRHVKTIVRHVFVIDDGETLEEVSTDQVEVGAAHWANYPQTTFAESVAALQRQVDESDAP